jgi:hypothetical protein
LLATKFTSINNMNLLSVNVCYYANMMSNIVSQFVKMYRIACKNMICCNDNSFTEMFIFVPFGTATAISKAAVHSLNQKVYKSVRIKGFTYS